MYRLLFVACVHPCLILLDNPVQPNDKLPIDFSDKKFKEQNAEYNKANQSEFAFPTLEQHKMDSDWLPWLLSDAH